jgi:hypothetical protein
MSTRVARKRALQPSRGRHLAPATPWTCFSHPSSPLALKAHNAIPSRRCRSGKESLSEARRRNKRTTAALAGMLPTCNDGKRCYGMEAFLGGPRYVPSAIRRFPSVHRVGSTFVSFSRPKASAAPFQRPSERRYLLSRITWRVNPGRAALFACEDAIRALLLVRPARGIGILPWWTLPCQVMHGVLATPSLSTAQLAMRMPSPDHGRRPVPVGLLYYSCICKSLFLRANSSRCGLGAFLFQIPFLWSHLHTLLRRKGFEI